MSALDIGMALDFLGRFAPGAPRALSASNKDQKFFATKTFSQGEEMALKQWVEAQQESGRNIYFLHNTTIHNINKKSERENIKSVDWFHIDIDPRAGENLAEEQTLALGKLTSNLPVGVPRPTVIVFSGGGYQAFWRLKEPIVIDGDLELAEDAKLYNLHLENLFSADRCHNIDRIMRLPGILQAGCIGARRPRNNMAPARTYLSGRGHRSILDMMGIQVPALLGESDQKLTVILKDWGFKKWGSGGENGWTAPSLLAMQSQWVEKVGPITWDNPDQVDWQEPAWNEAQEDAPF